MYLKTEDPDEEMVELIDAAFKTCMAVKLGIEDATQVGKVICNSLFPKETMICMMVATIPKVMMIFRE